MPFDILEELKKVLPPSSKPYHFTNLQSTPRESSPSIHKPRAQTPTKSIKVEHLLTLFHEQTPILALEVIVYITIPHDNSKIEKLIYIAKADSTGLTPQLKVKVRDVIQVFMQWLYLYPVKSYLSDIKVKKDIDYTSCITKPHDPFVSRAQRALHILAERAKGDTEYGMPIVTNVSDSKERTVPQELIEDSSKHVTRLVMFTRAEPEYLFPNSKKNKHKHISSDSQLLKWWLKTVANTVVDTFESVTQRKLNILNSETAQIKRFFPDDKWEVGDIYSNENNIHDPASN
ncbi:unnamed protein product [Ambrosiozyma monospora]|uniref:Unnamed protein product n=1 Tax=Ambrosiozyma monospora TaxID=43982 RepID=A0ACB5TDQ7_AMBMO|nr:unnamed protein product [Ambrosiozyma monospora]